MCLSLRSRLPLKMNQSLQVRLFLLVLFFVKQHKGQLLSFIQVLVVSGAFVWRVTLCCDYCTSARTAAKVSSCFLFDCPVQFSRASRIKDPPAGEPHAPSAHLAAPPRCVSPAISLKPRVCASRLETRTYAAAPLLHSHTPCLGPGLRRRKGPGALADCLRNLGHDVSQHALASEPRQADLISARAR